MKAATAKTRTRFENILFATDFSPAAAHAIPFVKAVAHHFQSNLVVLHVKPPVVNHSDSFRANVRDILFATDFASETPAAAAYAISLAQEFQARLTMLHVVPEGKPGELVSWSDVRDSSKQLLHKLVPDEAELWRKPEYFVERGDADERILDLANVREVDVIVLGAQPERGVPGAATHLPIATAHKVVAHAKCPVLTVRSRT